MFMGNLQGPYLDRIVGTTSSGISDLVLAGERMENMINMGTIESFTSIYGVVKKFLVSYGNKREGETNATMVIRT